MKVLITFVMLFALASPVFAQQTAAPPIVKLAQDSKETVVLPNPLVDKKGAKPSPASGSASAEELIQKYFLGNAIKVVLGILGSIALAMFVYGGYLWLVSGGNSATIKKGKDVFISATIGLAVVFGSALLVQKVIDALTTRN